MGMIRQDVKDSNDNYIAILEAYIDGKKVETIEMPYDYIKRKYDIFYNYDLEEGPHKLVIKWINPNENMPFNVKTWWFIHPYRQSQSILINKREKP